MRISAEIGTGVLTFSGFFFKIPDEGHAAVRKNPFLIVDFQLDGFSLFLDYLGIGIPAGEKSHFPDVP
jgi:hypothetical protein